MGILVAAFSYHCISTFIWFSTKKCLAYLYNLTRLYRCNTLPKNATQSCLFTHWRKKPICWVSVLPPISHPHFLFLPTPKVHMLLPYVDNGEISADISTVIGQARSFLTPYSNNRQIRRAINNHPGHFCKRCTKVGSLWRPWWALLRVQKGPQRDLCIQQIWPAARVLFNWGNNSIPLNAYFNEIWVFFASEKTHARMQQCSQLHLIIGDNRLVKNAGSDFFWSRKPPL